MINEIRNFNINLVVLVPSSVWPMIPKFVYLATATLSGRTNENEIGESAQSGSRRKTDRRFDDFQSETVRFAGVPRSHSVPGTLGIPQSGLSTPIRPGFGRFPWRGRVWLPPRQPIFPTSPRPPGRPCFPSLDSIFLA